MADGESGASTDPGWLQSEFNLMMGIFEQVRLRTDARNTVGMVCQPFRASGLQADKAYTQRRTV